MSLSAQGLTDRAGVGVMPIGRHPLRRVTNHIDSLLEEALRRFHVPLFAEHRINQVAIPIDGPIEVAPLSMDTDVCFIHVPGFPRLSASLSTQLICHERCKTSFPVSNGLMSEHKTALQEHLGQIAQAQLIAKPPEHDEQDDIGG